MPQDDKATAEVLGQYIATRNANPTLDDNVLRSKFPEIDGFASEKGVKPEVVIGSLNEYYDNYRSGKFSSLDDLNKNSSFFFSSNQEKPEVSSDQSQIESTQKPVVDKSVPEMTSDVLGQYIATRNANPTLDSSGIKSKFPEIDAYAKLKGVSSDVVVDDLNNYYDDYKSGKFGSLDELNAKYDFSAGLKKKGQPELVSGEEQLNTSNVQPPVDEQILDPNQTQPLVREQDQLVDPSQEQLIDGEEEIPELTNSLSRDETQIEGVKPKGLSIFGNIKAGTVNNIPNEELFSNLNLDVNTGLPFGVDPDFGPSISSPTVERVSKQQGIRQLATETLSDEEKAELDRYATEQFENSLITSFGISKEQFDENKGTWALKHKIADPKGESFAGGMGVVETRVNIRDKEAAKELKKNGDIEKDEAFKEALDLSGGDVEKANKLFAKRVDEIGFDFVDENALTIKSVREKIFELESKPERTASDDLAIKKLKNQLDELNASEGKTSLYDPETGMFVSGNTKEDSERIIEFNDKLDKLSLIYKETDLGTLRKLRDDALFKYVSVMNSISGDKPADAIILSGDVLKDLKSYNKFTDDLLANYMAVNRMITLNEDPGSVEDAGFFQSIGEGFQEAIGVSPGTQSALADRSIRQLESAGYEITQDQKQKLDKTLTQKVGSAIGSSIPISLEIGFNIMLANKVAGFLKIPQLAKAIAGGNKVAEFGLTMLYDAASQGAAFALAGENVEAGVGEGIGQTIGSALMKRLGFKNKMLNFITRTGTGAVTESIAEFSGQYLDELTQNGYNWEEASEATFGKTADELIEKVAITYFTALTMGIGGGTQESSFLFDVQKELKESGSDSPIVKTAIENDVTTPPTDVELEKLNKLDEKMTAGEEISEEEASFLELMAQKEDFQSEKPDQESGPVILKKEGEESSISVGGQKGFVSDAEVIEKLNDEEFVSKVKTGETTLEVSNPSEELEAKLAEVFEPVAEITSGSFLESLKAEQAKGLESTESEVAAGEPVSEVSQEAPEVVEQRTVTVSEGIGPKGQTEAKVLNETVVGNEKKLFVEFEDGTRLWTNEPAVTEKESTTEAATSEGLKTEIPAAKVVPDKSIAVPINTTSEKVSTSDKNKIKKVIPATPTQAIMQGFLSGMKLKRKTLVEETGFGITDSKGDKRGKTEESARKNFIGDDGFGIDEMIVSLRESNPGVFENMEDSQVRDAIIDVVTSNETRNDIALKLRDEFTSDGMIYFDQVNNPSLEQDAAVIEEYTEREREYNEAVTQEEVNVADIEAEAKEFEEYINSKTDGEIEQEFGAISETKAAEPEPRTESKVEPGKEETSTAKQEKNIAETAKEVADYVRSFKFDITGMDKLSSTPIPVVKAAYNSAFTAAALTIEASGTIAQAVANGLKAIKNTGWYKSLSETARKRIDENIASQLEGAAKEAFERKGKESKPASKKPKESKSFIEQMRENQRKQKENAPAGSLKLNPKNKRFAERIDKQSTLNEETKKQIVEGSKNERRNQKELLKEGEKIFDSIMSQTDGNWQEVINVADRGDIALDMKEVLYAHAMQHLSVLEKSADPAISKAASNSLVDLGIRTAERLNAAGKEIKAIGTIYGSFQIYAFYSAMARVEHFAHKKNSKQETRPGAVKEEYTSDLDSIISDIEENLDEYLKDPEIAKKMEAIKKKLDGRPVRPKKLTKKKKKALADKRANIIKKGFGRGDTLQSGIPLGKQSLAIVELAATYIEEGFYASQDIVNNVVAYLKSVGVDYDKNEIREVLEKYDKFQEILEKEKTSKAKDSLGSTIAQSVSQYLREGLEFSKLSMKDAILSSDATKEKIKSDLVENIKNDFEVTEKQAEAVVQVVDQIFREKSAELLNQSYKKFFPTVSMKKAVGKKAIDKFVDDVSLGAFDATQEFINMTFQKYGMVNANNPEIIGKLKEMSDKVRNAPEGVIKNNRRKKLETFIHEQTKGYGFADWLMTRFYGSILSGVVTHAKNLKYNTIAIGVMGPLSQMYQTGANPLRTWGEMIKSFVEVDRKIAANYIVRGSNLVDSSPGPKTYADSLKFNLIRNGFTKLLNVTSTRFLVASDMIMTRPFAAAVFKNSVKAWIREEQGLKGKALEEAALEQMGYTQSNVDKSSKQALADVTADYGFDPFSDNTSNSIKKEAAAMLILRTQELILENSGIKEKMGTEAWLDKWNGESLEESSTTEARNLALQGDVMGVVGIVTGLLEKLTTAAPALKYKVPFVRILGNMLNMGIKWTPLIGQAQLLTRVAVNKARVKKGKEPTSSTAILMAEAVSDRLKIPFLKDGILQQFNSGQSYKEARRDLKNVAAITASQALIYALMAKDEDDEGLVITGMFDKSFFTRQSIEKGTGVSPYSLYWRNSEGDLKFISEYKNSATGFAFSFFGAMSDEMIVNQKDATTAFAASVFSAPFFIADKPAATSIKELWDDLSPVDKYGNNKLLDDKGYIDWLSNGLANFTNSTFVPNLFKQSNKIAEQVYGADAKRATNWWQALVKGIPWANQNLLETQVDHFGEDITQKFELGFLGIQGNTEEGFTFLEPKEVDPYYEVYTDHGQTPKWFTQKEIPVFEKDEFGDWDKVSFEKLDGGKENATMRLSKYDAHFANSLIGVYRKEGMDNYEFFETQENGSTKIIKGLDGLSKLNGADFKSEISSIDSKAKKDAFIYFFENYYDEEIKLNNEDKTKTFIKNKK